MLDKNTLRGAREFIDHIQHLVDSKPNREETCGRCADCEWWDTEDGHEGLCSAIGDEYMFFDSERRAWWPENSNGMLFLHTKSDFGCFDFRQRTGTS